LRPSLLFALPKRRASRPVERKRALSAFKLSGRSAWFSARNWVGAALWLPLVDPSVPRRAMRVPLLPCGVVPRSFWGFAACGRRERLRPSLLFALPKRRASRPVERKRAPARLDYVTVPRGSPRVTGWVQPCGCSSLSRPSLAALCAYLCCLAVWSHVRAAMPPEISRTLADSTWHVRWDRVRRRGRGQQPVSTDIERQWRGGMTLSLLDSRKG